MRASAGQGWQAGLPARGCRVADGPLQSERLFRYMSDRYYELRDAVVNGDAPELDRAQLYEDLAALALFAADWFKAGREGNGVRR
jgi:hypothetical protein